MWAGGYLKGLLLSSVSEYHGGMSDNNGMISDEAVEAAVVAYFAAIDADEGGIKDDMRAALEAAAPHMTGSAEAIWLEGYKAGVRDADKDAQRRKAGDFLRFDELEANPYRSQA